MLHNYSESTTALVMEQLTGKLKFVEAILSTSINTDRASRMDV